MNRGRGTYGSAEVERYRRERERMDAEPVGPREFAGFGFGNPYDGPYAHRPRYSEPWIRTHPEGDRAQRGATRRQHDERHLRAYADRELARHVDLALYDVIGPEADAIAVYANDAVVTLEGTLPSARAAHYVLDAVRDMPGVRRVRNALRVPRYR